MQIGFFRQKQIQAKEENSEKKKKKKKETNFHVYKFCNRKHLLNSFIREIFF